MISSLVPSDYPFGTLFLPFWCLLITLWYQLLTPLVHSRYLFDSFGIPSFLHSANPFVTFLLLPSVCPFHWYLLPSHCFLVPSDYPLWYLLVNHFATFCLSVCYFLVAALVPSDNPLVPSAYLFGIFCLPIWYLLITPLIDLIWLWWLTSLSVIFQLYHGDQL